MTTTPTLPDTERSFFIVGGTLPPDAPSYIERKADSDLFHHLAAGDFHCVLTSRQMGKSSLMVRTAIRLRQAGTRVATLDLTDIGKNVTPEQWYNGLLVQLGDAFGLEAELDDYWSKTTADENIGPLLRWKKAIREVIVASIPGNIVIFIDEIDGVRSLNFATDEFFEGIRGFYNDRTTDPELRRLTFCLVGVATPTDLIRNFSTTPFNVGVRVVLSDFTEEEARPFLKGLDHPPEIAATLLRRILWWTGGHPYLTQRLCASIAEDRTIVTAAGVDRVCQELFLSSRSRETDNNLQFVSRRITERNANRPSAKRRSTDQDRDDTADSDAEGGLATLLDLYGRVRAGKHVRDDDTNPNIEFLRLAGIVAVRNNRLVVRNRIYAHVFDTQWIRAHMPDAEARRQRIAFFRGLLMAAVGAAAIFAIIGALMLKDLEDEQKTAIQNYCANMVQVQQDFDSGDYASGYNLLRETVPLRRLQPRYAETLLSKTPFLNRSLPFILRHPRLYAILNGFDEKAAAGIEWNYLLSRSFGDSAWAYSGHINEVRSVAISPHGDWVVTAGADSTVRVFKVGTILQATGDTPDNPLDRALLVLDSKGTTRLSKPHAEPPNSPDWSVNADLLQALNDGNIPASQLPGVLSVQFSPDGAWIAIATGNWDQTSVPGTVYLWSTKDPSVVIWVDTRNSNSVVRVDKQFGKAGFAKAVDAVVFKQQPDAHGAYDLACTSEDNTAEFWSVAPDGTPTLKGMFPAEEDQKTTHLPGGQPAKTLPDGWPSKGMNSAVYSTDGKHFAMIFGDGSLWIRDGAQPWSSGASAQVLGDISGLMSVAFYDHSLTGPHAGSNEQLLLIGTRDGQVKTYNIDGKTPPARYLDTGQGLVTSLTISWDKNLLLTTGSTGTTLVWQLLRDPHDHTLDPNPTRTPGDSIMLRGARDVTYSAAIARDNSFIVSGGASALTGGSGQRSTPDADKSKSGLVSAPGGRVLFWKKQQGYVDGIALPGDPWPLTTWASQPDTIAKNNAVVALAFSPDGHEIATIVGVPTQQNAPTSIDFTRLDPQSSKPADSVTADTQNHPGTALAWSVDGQSAVVATNDGRVLLLDPANIRAGFKQLDTIAVKDPKTGNDVKLPIQALSFSPDGLLAGTAASIGGADQTFNWGKAQSQFDSDQSVILWKPGQYSNMQKDIKNVVELPPVDSNSTFSLQKLIFSPAGGWLAACGADGGPADNLVKVQIWSIASLLDPSPKPLRTLDGSEFPSSDPHTDSLHGQCTAVAFSPNGKWLAVGTYSHEIAVWSTSTWLRVEGAAEFIAGGSLYGATGNPRGRYLDVPPMADSAINTVAFSPDSARLAYGTADGKIYLWSVTAQLPVSTLTVHTGGVLSLAFSPNGNCLASGGNDKTVRFSCGLAPNYNQRAKDISLSPYSSLRLTGESNDWYGFAQ